MGDWPEEKSLRPPAARPWLPAAPGEPCEPWMPLLSLRAVEPLPLPQYLPPGPLGKDKVMLQPLCHPSVLLLPASPTAHCSEATDLSLKALTHSCGQRILADSGRGLSWGRPPSGPGELGGMMVHPQGRETLLPQNPFSCHCSLGPCCSLRCALGPSEPEARC